MEIKGGFRFSLRCLFETFELRSTCAQKFMYVFVKRVRYYCPILTKIGKYQHFSVELSSIKFHENALSGSEVVARGQIAMGA